ncbi:MAG: hypothetical protein LBD50_02745 [Rickettsiales bacterium]|jgi:hypothetical protein|nr:hypothetical protein [Rickettsiales bacterium]
MKKKTLLIPLLTSASLLFAAPNDSRAAYASISACINAGGAIYDDTKGNCGCKVVKSTPISNGTRNTTTCETVTGMQCIKINP